ncbi:MAG: GTP pyrophosphokinase, partial [Candidatus Dormibacteraceae bacterium]
MEQVLTDDVSRDYSLMTAPLRELGHMMEQLIRQLLGANGIGFHSVSHRVKTADSVSRKIERSSAGREIDSLTDLLGLRIITYFRDDVDHAARVIEQEFCVNEANSVDKRAILDPDRFGYLSMHYIVKLSSGRETLVEYRAYAGIQFEIQIRSILQHAWAEMEHDLGYKSEAAIPRDIRRSFSRLAGLLEVADDEFARIRGNLANFQSTVDADVRKGQQDIEINQNSLLAFAKSSREYLSLVTVAASCFKLPAPAPIAREVGYWTNPILG